MDYYMLGYHKDDIKHEQGLILFKNEKHAMKESDEYFCMFSDSLEIAKKEYKEHREHYLTKIFMY